MGKKTIKVSELTDEQLGHLTALAPMLAASTTTITCLVNGQRNSFYFDSAVDSPDKVVTFKKNSRNARAYAKYSLEEFNNITLQELQLLAIDVKEEELAYEINKLESRISILKVALHNRSRGDF